ncbi:MAG: hypothetical protein AAF990_10575 [Bacteroidota bacterium]
MRFFKYILCLLVFTIGAMPLAEAHVNPEKENKRKAAAKKARKANLRMDCAQSTAQIDMDINNVRARLLAGGDIWWDGDDGRYIVPKVDPASGLPEVSSLFAGAVWLGGVDDANNLKVAAQTYGTASGQSDFWPGPLTPDAGTVDAETCINWDRFFTVSGANIDIHLANYELFSSQGLEYDPDLIPADIKNWPGRGNEFFADAFDFDLPNTSQGLGAFFDRDGDDIYEPQDGDYPVIEVAGCDDPQYPDIMYFNIYNDAGGIHTESNGAEIRMEVQVQSFAYATNDEVNNMTFQRYKLINRAVASIDSMFFAMWVDPDLGCYTDDYVGCDTSRSLAFVYNEDAQDGTSGCTCDQGVNTYCNEIPLIGVDYFRGPRNEFFEELGMSSFTYYNNGAVGNNPPGTTDPDNAVEYYRYLSGSWRDGTPFTFGGSGYDVAGTNTIKYAFTEAPDQIGGWSMCEENLPFGDRRTIQATGPFRLDPGAVNELIVGAVWVPFADYPCPDISDLLAADELAQGLFDNCFDILDGPDAPDVDWLELDRELVAVLTNDTVTTFNNRFEEYEEVDPLAPKTLTEDARKYKFEGYKIYQLNGPNVGTGDIADPDKARIVQVVDIKNGIREIYNWNAVSNPSRDPNAPRDIWVPEIQTENATDEGIAHTFQITEDQFAPSDRRLINHRKYYFLVIAYAHNEYEEFSQDNGVLSGQRRPYLVGRRNIKVYTVTPRPIVDVKLNAQYGDGTIITRVDGEGAGGRFIGVTKENREAMLVDGFDGRVEYRPGQAPIEVKIFNPLGVQNGNYRLTFIDEDLANDQLDSEVRWELTNTDNNEVIVSEKTIDRLNEEILPEYGFSISIEQSGDAGDLSESNGAIGASLNYEDESLQWLSFLPDGAGAGFNGFTNFVRTDFGEADFDLDPRQALTNVAGRTFVPFYLTNYVVADAPILTPAWLDNNGRNVRRRADLEDLNNVDVVFTSDKTKWSRCVVVESASQLWTDANSGVGAASEGDAEQFDLRAAPAVGTEDADGDGLPDPDGSGLTGMGWFPGYAVDVETGERLNIFFGENSTYSVENADRVGGVEAYDEAPKNGKLIGNDMMWNPSSQNFLNPPINGLYQAFFGGHHFIYVTNEPYDECEGIRELLANNRSSSKINALRDITWTAIPLLQPDQRLLSYADGLIPTETVMELRVDNPYEVKLGTGEANGYPTYEFSFDGVEAQALTTEFEINEQLDQINVVPNPYYGFSNYETSQFTTTVKITNLPAECTVTIFTLDGKFIRQYKRNEVGADLSIRNNKGFLTGQVIPAIEWDLRNNKGIPVASGTYLIHVDAPGLGERVIKWFGIARQFDPSGL